MYRRLRKWACVTLGVGTISWTLLVLLHLQGHLQRHSNHLQHPPLLQGLRWIEDVKDAKDEVLKNAKQEELEDAMQETLRNNMKEEVPKNVKQVVVKNMKQVLKNMEQVVVKDAKQEVLKNKKQEVMTSQDVREKSNITEGVKEVLTSRSQREETNIVESHNDVASTISIPGLGHSPKDYLFYDEVSNPEAVNP
nr:uncharacterized protein LOC128702968 [Cherax quadricarinatus]